MPTLLKLCLLGGALLAVLYLAVCALLFFTQRDLLFPAPKQGRMPRAGRVVRPKGGGLFLYWAPPAPGAPVLVHFHGNAEEAADSEFLAEHFQVGLAAVEYPGYGLLAREGAPSEASIVAAAASALAELTGPMHLPPGQLVLSGQSVGTGVAVEMARRGFGARLLLTSPYTSLPDVAARVMPAFPARLLMRDRFDSASKATEVKVPVLIVHGTDDEVIPYDLGKALSRLFPHAALLTVAQGHHNDLWSHREVAAAIGRFIENAP